MSRIPLETPEPRTTYRLIAIYWGTDYPGLIQGQEYKIELTYDFETTFILKTNKSDEVYTCSGLIDFIKNFRQVNYVNERG